MTLSARYLSAIGIGSLLAAAATSMAISADTPRPAKAARPGKVLSADEVREIEKKLQTERAAAEQAGLRNKVAPVIFERVEELTRRGEAALAAGRLVEA